MLRLDFNLVFTILNIVIWYVLIRKFLFKPINNIITKREEALNARYDEVKQLQAEAQAEKDKSVQYQNQIESEKAKVMAQAQLDARKEFDQIVSDAHKKEASLLEEKVMNKAEQEIRGMILEAAVKSMQSEHNDEALYDEFLTKAGESTHEES